MTGEPRKWMKRLGGTALCLSAGAAFALMIVAHAPVEARQGAAMASPGAASSSTASGVFTDEQAGRGEALSDKQCATCHGPGLTGAEAGPTLVGEEFITVWKGQTLADFHDRVHKTMPADAPGSMTPQQTSDVTAYVLKLNKFPAGTAELPSDLAQLKRIMIEGPPNP